jgi:RHS repeat-associated protein
MWLGTRVEKYRYGFQGQERDDEISGNGNSYTAEFWEYDPRIGRRWNIDPVDKEHESPYACFANNPICFSDPNGADTLDFNKNGDITRYAKGGEDVFRKLNENNEVENSISFKKGTFQYKWKYNNEKDEDNKPLKIDVLQIKGNENGKQIFEFLAENTEVEWSCIKTKFGSSENAFITTSHEKTSEAGSTKLYSQKLIKQNYVILEDIHCHPRNTAYPSGSWTVPEKGFTPVKRKGEWGDTGHAHGINENIKQKQTVLYQIYLPKTKKYIKYNEDSSVYDYR